MMRDQNVKATTASLKARFRAISLAVGLLCAFAVVQASILWKVCNRGADALGTLDQQGLPCLRDLAALQEQFALYRLHAFEALFAQEKDKPHRLAAARDSAASVQAIADKLPQLLPPENRVQVAEFESSFQNLVRTFARVQSLLESDFAEAMKIVDQDVPRVVEKLNNETAALKEAGYATSAKQSGAALASFDSIKRNTFGFGAASVLLACGAAMFIQVIALRTRAQLRQIAARLFHQAQETTSAAHRVSHASGHMASGASRQSATLEKAVGELKHLDRTIAENAENARKANAFSNTARLSAENGATQMRDMVQAINRIRSSSDNIAKIIKTIDDIAFQTNILALNAAVEAARAGQVGAGFAVVADQVRNLAQRSAAAARETADRISESIQSSQDGVDASTRVARTLEQIVTHARDVDRLVVDIGTACAAQTEGMTRLHQAIREVELLTASNSEHTESMAASSTQFASQAQTQGKLVEQLQGLLGDSFTAANGESVEPQSDSMKKRGSKPDWKGQPDRVHLESAANLSRITH